MAFDWRDYETLASSLRKGDEASQRSAISRLYYSVLHRARLKLEATDPAFIFSEDRPSHQQVWDTYLKKGRTFNSIGNKGKQLKRNRELADYYSEIKRLDDVVEESFQTAKSILMYINQIP
jgi:hypothetical protein